MILPKYFILLLLVTPVPADDAVSFHRQVVPILKANCVSCHKPGKSKGGLDLTAHATLVKGGKHGAVIKAGDVNGSKVIESISGAEPEMPRDGEPLTAAEVDVLSRWISQGAKEDAPADTGTRKPGQPPVYTSLPAVHTMAFSPDGAVLAVAGHQEIILH